MGGRGNPSKESIEVVVKLEIFWGKNYFEEISKTVKCNFSINDKNTAFLLAI